MYKPITTKLKRCTKCNRILREENKSGLCTSHYNKRTRKLNAKKYQANAKMKRKRLRTDFCSRCGVECSGKLLIEIKKNLYYGFCSDCFEKVRVLKLKEVREIVYNNNKKETFK